MYTQEAINNNRINTRNKYYRALVDYKFNKLVDTSNNNIANLLSNPNLTKKDLYYITTAIDDYKQNIMDEERASCIDSDMVTFDHKKLTLNITNKDDTDIEDIVYTLKEDVVEIIQEAIVNINANTFTSDYILKEGMNEIPHRKVSNNGLLTNSIEVLNLMSNISVGNTVGRNIDKDNYSQDFHVLVSSINEMVDSNKKNKKLNNYLLNKVFRIQEEERKMLSRELHDEVSQSLASLLFLLSNLVEKETDKVKKDRLLLIQSEIENSLTNIRNIAVNLRPPSAELSLEEVISKYIEDYKNLYGISVDFYSNYEGGKNDNFDITLYRIIQESLSNIKRHSGATEVIVKLYGNSDYIILSIADNGIGLTKERVESAKKEGRLGIFGIQERILDFSGEFKVLNNKKYSTIIMCKFKTETIEEKSNENTID